MTEILSVDQSGEMEAGSIDPGKLISGDAATQLWHKFSDSTEQFHVGQWASGPCKLSVQYDENELCVLLEGTATVTDEGGNAKTYSQGEAFVIPAGFKGTWESVTAVRKIYASFEQA